MNDTDEGQAAIEAACRAFGENPDAPMVAAIKAWLAVLPGWRMVPEEPTERMLADGVISLIDNGLDGPDGVGHSDVSRCWANMVEAAAEDKPPPGLEDSDE